MLHLQMKNQIDALVDAASYQAAEVALQSLIAVEPDCLPAYQKLGVTYLRLQNYAAAERYLLHAARSMPADPNAFDGLAETFALRGDVVRARQAGRRALLLKDASAPFVADPLRSAPARPGGTRLIAFSLFGAEPRYCETAVMNAHLAPTTLPGWTCRFYVDASVPLSLVRRLDASGAQVVTVDGGGQRLPGTMWRFLALDDPTAEAVICRDADSLLSPREADWVGAWLESGMPFHIMRDFFSHTELMLAGLFGVRGGVVSDVAGMMRDWLSNQRAVVRWTDQYFLRAQIWPLARDTALTHDPWFGYGSHVVSGTAVCADVNHHVGANHSAGAMGIKLDHPDGTSALWTLVDAADRAVCSYVGTVRDGELRAEIPRHYSERLRRGELNVRWEVTSGSAAGNRTGLARVPPSADGAGAIK